MQLAELSPEDQQLVNTPLDPELEKEAQAQIAQANEMYGHGYNVLALETADGIDKAAADDDDDDDDDGKMKYENKKDEEDQEKKAAALGAFIERGYFDGLVKLGEDHHKNAFHYFTPFIQEKVAEVGKEAALGKFSAANDLVNKTGRKAMELTSKAGKKVKDESAADVGAGLAAIAGKKRKIGPSGTAAMLGSDLGKAARK